MVTHTGSGSGQRPVMQLDPFPAGKIHLINGLTYQDRGDPQARERMTAPGRPASPRGVEVHSHLAVGMPHGHLNRYPALGRVDESLTFLARGLISATGRPTDSVDKPPHLHECHLLSEGQSP